MKQEDYKATWDRLFEESMELESRRASLETELSEVRNEIAHLEEVLSHLRPLAGVTYGGHIEGLGITDAIRVVINNAKAPMSATEIKKDLENNGFDFSQMSSPMSSIYKILSRLEEAGTIVRFKDEAKRGVFYGKPEESSEISDDDIPF